MKAEFPLSSAKIKALKNDLAKLTDVEYLRKELARIAEEIKGFDMHLALSPQAKRRLRALESRFRQLKAAIARLQRQVDQEINKFASILRRSVGMAGGAKKTARKAKTTRRAAKKTTRKKAARAPVKG
jgi:predicted RNase H-like nuclease (RuvC/YqgF family)